MSGCLYHVRQVGRSTTDVHQMYAQFERYAKLNWEQVQTLKRLSDVLSCSGASYESGGCILDIPKARWSQWSSRHSISIQWHTKSIVISLIRKIHFIQWNTPGKGGPGVPWGTLNAVAHAYYNVDCPGDSSFRHLDQRVHRTEFLNIDSSTAAGKL